MPWVDDFERQAFCERLSRYICHSLQALLVALWPLCQRMRSLQDYIILVLRKIMFARDVNSR